MKKCLISLFCLLLLTGCATSSNNTEKSIQEQWDSYLVDNGIELATDSIEMIESGIYNSLYGDVLEEDFTSQLLAIDFKKPKQVFIIMVPDSIYESAINQYLGSEISESVRSHLTTKFHNGLASYISSIQGNKFLSMSSILSLGVSVAKPETMEQNAFVLFDYGLDYQYLLTCTLSKDDTINLTGTFIKLDDFELAEIENGEFSFDEYIDYSGVSITSINEDRLNEFLE